MLNLSDEHLGPRRWTKRFKGEGNETNPEFIKQKWNWEIMGANNIRERE